MLPLLRGLMKRAPNDGRSDMAAEVRHCERCDHEFEVEVSSAGSSGQVEGCPETAPDCGFTQPGEQVKVVREID